MAKAASKVVGFISIEFLLRYLRKHSTYVFVLYRILLAILLLFLLSNGTLAQ